MRGTSFQLVFHWMGRGSALSGGGARRASRSARGDCVPVIRRPAASRVRGRPLLSFVSVRPPPHTPPHRYLATSAVRS